MHEWLSAVLSVCCWLHHHAIPLCYTTMQRSVFHTCVQNLRHNVLVMVQWGRCLQWRDRVWYAWVISERPSHSGWHTHVTLIPQVITIHKALRSLFTLDCLETCDHCCLVCAAVHAVVVCRIFSSHLQLSVCCHGYSPHNAEWILRYLLHHVLFVLIKTSWLW